MRAGILRIGSGANSYYVGAPQYKVGDLVKACFTYFEYYTYPYFDEDDLFYPWLGIIVMVSFDHELFGDEPLYEIVCTDGYIRWYSEFELQLVNKS